MDPLEEQFFPLLFGRRMMREEVYTVHLHETREEIRLTRICMWSPQHLLQRHPMGWL